MTSERQRAANRANAAKSTGPRTREGKAKTSQNAHLHGLAAALRNEPDALAEIERMAQAIVAEVGRPDLIGLARRIAEAELDLRRARRARQTLARLPTAGATDYRLIELPNSKLFRTVVRRLNRRKQSSKEDLTELVFSAGWVPGAPEFVEAPARRGKNIKAQLLERYELRATSRREFAIHDFDTARSCSSGKSTDRPTNQR